MDQLQQFINQFNGQKGVGDTKENKGQCVGVIEEWLDDTLHLSHVWGDAMDLLRNADPNVYTAVYNSATGVPPRGAVLVFKKEFNGTVGHTGIVTKADVKTFELFEQNNPTGAGCRLHTYPNYAYVLGWIIPKTQASNTVQLDSKKFEELVSKSSKYDEFVKLGLTDPSSVKKQLDDLSKRPESCPPAANPRHEQALAQIQAIINNLG